MPLCLSVGISLTIVNNFCCKTISSIQFSKRNSSITAPSLFRIVPFRSSDRHTCSIVRIYCLFDHSSKENTSFLKYILTWKVQQGMILPLCPPQGSPRTRPQAHMPNPKGQTKIMKHYLVIICFIAHVKISKLFVPFDQPYYDIWLEGYCINIFR